MQRTIALHLEINNERTNRRSANRPQRQTRAQTTNNQDLQSLALISPNVHRAAANTRTASNRQVNKARRLSQTSRAARVRNTKRQQSRRATTNRNTRLASNRTPNRQSRARVNRSSNRNFSGERVASRQAFAGQASNRSLRRRR